MGEFPDLKVWKTQDKVEEKLRDSNWVFERKYDGTAAILSIKDGSVTLTGRGILKDGSNQDYAPKFPEIIKAFSKFSDKNTSLIGELVYLKDGINEDFSKIQKRTSRKDKIDEIAKEFPATFMIFDASLIYEDIRHEPYAYRRALIYNEFGFCGERFKVVQQARMTNDKITLLEAMNKDRWEGIVVKDLFAPYGVNQYKYKLTDTHDVFWEGEYVPGKNKNEGMVGSLICYQYFGEEKREVARVSGMDDLMRIKFTDLKDEINQTNPMVLEVQAHEVLKSGKLRYPAFIRIRDDKGARQCICSSEKSELPAKVGQLDTWY